MKQLLLLLALLVPFGCAPRALYFHESTKVGFAADYNSSDSQPVASNFGYKRRIVAVVPAQERVSPDGRDRNGVNRGEALSLVSKFHVRVGSYSEGVTITNRFASGAAARRMTSTEGSSASLNALLHSDSVVTEVFETPSGPVPVEKSANSAVNDRIESIMRRYVAEDTSGPSGERIRIRNGKPVGEKIERSKKNDEAAKPRKEPGSKIKEQPLPPIPEPETDKPPKVNGKPKRPLTGPEAETVPAKTKIIIGPDGKPREVPIQPAAPTRRPPTGAKAEQVPAKTRIIIGPDGQPKDVPINNTAPKPGKFPNR
ncbi:MAG: hypothetical protein ABL994_21455 [Verrucomicrobiales bacterium]